MAKMVNNQRNHILTFHNQTTMSRLLCECELYSPTNYDSDPEMKRVMQQFVDRTTQRFHEYDERMKTTRQKCREQCDKEIQKIILKDKLEKQMEQHFDTLQTDIQSDAIPTCVCEKSIADKVEKGCLRCGGLLGGGIAPGWGLVSGLGYVGWTNYVTQTALQKGIEEGVKAGIEGLKVFPGLSRLIEVSQIQSFINPANYAEKTTYFSFVEKVKTTKCVDKVAKLREMFCNSSFISSENALSQRASEIAENAAYMAKHAETEVLNASASSLTTFSNAITASVVAILVIVLVMIIIYLILRYRRKKKMKKKLQYIKLLDE
ncbi:rifin [Plasmodium falciparum IGH-CR14]|uniref:Rifin n=1 Tax=Plasmodium falciparum IGH-CR14 TaxID=580059 RepID=A0A0L1I3Z6_PLAFA|nr:rifin [Plasmodium falciparum IGH-CR14]